VTNSPSVHQNCYAAERQSSITLTALSQTEYQRKLPDHSAHPCLQACRVWEPLISSHHTRRPRYRQPERRQPHLQTAPTVQHVGPPRHTPPYDTSTLINTSSPDCAVTARDIGVIPSTVGTRHRWIQLVFRNGRWDFFHLRSDQSVCPVGVECDGRLVAPDIRWGKLRASNGVGKYLAQSGAD